MRRFVPTMVLAASLIVPLAGPAFAVSDGTAPPAPAESTLKTVVLTPADTGRTILVHPDDTIVLDFGDRVSGDTTWSWNPGVSSNETVVVPSAALELPATIGFLFHAGARGVATITAESGCHVTAPGGVCPLIILEFRVTVIVVPPCTGPPTRWAVGDLAPACPFAAPDQRS